MIRGLAPLARIGVVTCIASCASAPPRGDARAADGVAIAPFALYGECFDLAAGDRLDYRYESRIPVDFDLRYGESGAVVSPIVRPQSTADSDLFAVRVPARYCATWQAGAEANRISYRLLVRRANPPTGPAR